MRYARDRNTVELLEVAEISGDEFVPLGSMHRAEVVGLIIRGYGVCTVVDGLSPVLNRGRRVHLVQTSWGLFLRTDGRLEPGDQLVDLLEF